MQQAAPRKITPNTHNPFIPKRAYGNNSHKYISCLFRKYLRFTTELNLSFDFSSYLEQPFILATCTHACGCRRRWGGAHRHNCLMPSFFFPIFPSTCCQTRSKCSSQAFKIHFEVCLCWDSGCFFFQNIFSMCVLASTEWRYVESSAWSAAKAGRFSSAACMLNTVD